MPQGEDATRYQTERDAIPHWSDRAVSWGHLLFALVATVGSIAAVIVANEARLTRLEERVATAAAINAMQDERYYKTVQRRDEEYSKLRFELLTKLDKVDADLTSIKVSVGALRK